MPSSTRIPVKASFVYLCLGCVIGAVLLINRWLPLWEGVSALRGSHVVFLLVGWLTQLILGVGWWLLPPLHIRLQGDVASRKRHGPAQRGSELLFWTTIGLLNAGILLRAIGAPLFAWTKVEAFDVMAALSGILLLAAAVVFVAVMWGRVRELGRR